MAVSPSSRSSKVTQELCPHCGEFVNRLMLDTGWCVSCSGYNVNTSLLVEQWLTTNANAVEHYLLQGNSLSKSIDLVAKGLKPVCVVCGTEMNNASRGSVFCRRNATCRKFARRYTYLYQDKGLTKAQALARIMIELSE